MGRRSPWIVVIGIIAAVIGGYRWYTNAAPSETLARLWPLPGAGVVTPLGVSRDPDGTYVLSGSWEWQLSDAWLSTRTERDIIVFGVRDGNGNPVPLTFSGVGNGGDWDAPNVRPHKSKLDATPSDLQLTFQRSTRRRAGQTLNVGAKGTVFFMLDEKPTDLPDPLYVFMEWRVVPTDADEPVTTAFQQISVSTADWDR